MRPKNTRVRGIEVKASRTLAKGDGRGLARLAAHCGKSFQQGILLYTWEALLPMGGDKRMLAVPLSELWER